MTARTSLLPIAPTIRCYVTPRDANFVSRHATELSLSTLAGLPTRIYQTVYEGALAFFVVVSKGVDLKNSAFKLSFGEMICALVAQVSARALLLLA